ncbi:MAG TPA: HDOD domain-containing protein [Lacipirellulaceae bacterium]|nr:HDOD domain-containing protein [Lacipirellulaceae bacterium]
MNEVASQLEEIASRAITLYSRPTVAIELMRLAEEPGVDARALKDCVSQDPALTCKVLRVVNSSLYGLNRAVGDLSQAIGLLGIKPLKLLVLGFNLPDALFAEVAARQLQWYWTNTLTRAVAARLLAEELWRGAPQEVGSGDEAFIAGLLQDIGMLVLLRELGEPYAKFLNGVIDEKCHLASLEQDTLGFDHTQLSAELLSRWHMPQRLVDAIAAPKKLARLARMAPPEGDLAQILHLAEMLMQLVGQRRLNVLPDLLEAGKEYRGMTKSKLALLVGGLQPQVDQLAGSLSLELSEDRDYMQMLVEAHAQMAAVGEEIASEAAAASPEDQAYNQLLAHTNDLSDAMRSFLTAGNEQEGSGRHRNDQHAAHADDVRAHDAKDVQFGECKDGSALVRKLMAAANRCRDRRQELSLLLVEPNVFDIHSDSQGDFACRQARQALGCAIAPLDTNNVVLVSLSKERTAAILLNCDKRGAISVANHAIAILNKGVVDGVQPNGDLATTLSIGVSTSSVVPRNFEAARMIESAERCLAAARICGISTAKSIEV